MVATVFPADAVAGEPAYSGRELRQVHAPALAGATAARPLGARSGVRPGTSTTTVTATSTTWTVRPFAGVIDGEAAVEAGPYWFAFDTNTTGAVTAANATNPRIDIVYVRVDDPAEGDGTAAPAVAIGYLAGTAAASPVAPPTPARSFAIARINVPAAGGGSPSVTWVAPYATTPGAPVPVRSDTERDAVATAWGATDENPLTVLHIGASNTKKGVLEQTFDGLTWRTPGSTPWTATPTFAGAWVNFGAPHQVAQYRRVGDTVELRGLIKSGSGTICTLPAGFRPAANERFITTAAAGVADIQVEATGVVSVQFLFAGGSNAYVSLAGVRFAAV